MIDSTQAPVKPNATMLSPKPVDWIGIDGCRGGWIIAWLKDGCPAEIRFAESLQPFLKQAPKDAVILIDMILYKPDEISLENNSQQRTPKVRSTKARSSKTEQTDTASPQIDLFS